MKRIDKIIEHPAFVTVMQTITQQETDRVYCRHGIEHCLDVARIAYIRNLEEHLEIPKDVIYAAALLHDLGRSEEYKNGTPHHEAGADLAERILADCSYTEAERADICAAIRAHKFCGEEAALSRLLYEADKQSRNCFSCGVRESCYWPEYQKNQTIQY